MGKEHSAEVLHLIETGGPGGAERMLLEVTRHLDASFHSTVGLLKSGWLEDQVKGRGLPYVLIKGGRWKEFGRIRHLVRVVRESAITVIHTHEFYMNVLGAAVSRLTGVPLVATVHGRNYYPDQGRRRALYRFVASTATALVAVSEDLKAFFCQATGVPGEKVTVVYNGIDTSYWTPAVPDLARRQQIGIPSEAVVLGAIGNLYPVKRHIDLVRALPRIKAECPGVHAIILGRGDQKEILLREAALLGVSDRLHLLGFQEDTRPWMNIMDCFVMPSESEGMPLSLLEAMSVRLPVVVTAVGGIPEVVRPEHSGWLVPAHNSEVLADTVVRVIRNPSLARSVAAQARLRIEEAFSAKAMASAYARLYRQGQASS